MYTWLLSRRHGRHIDMIRYPRQPSFMYGGMCDIYCNVVKPGPASPAASEQADRCPGRSDR